MSERRVVTLQAAATIASVLSVAFTTAQESNDRETIIDREVGASGWTPRITHDPIGTRRCCALRVADFDLFVSEPLFAESVVAGLDDRTRGIS